MSEGQLSKEVSIGEDVITPEVKSALQLEKVISSLEALNDKTQGMRFSTEEEAHEGSRVYAAKTIEALNQIENVAKINLLLSGHGVQVPDLNINPVEGVTDASDEKLRGTSGTYVSVNPQQPLRSLLPYEVASGRIFSALGTIQKDSDTTYTMKMALIVDLGQVDRSETQVPVGDKEIPMIVTSVFKRGIVYIGENSVIEFEALKLKRDKEAEERTFSRTALSNGPFAKYLNKLSTVLRSESAEKFIPVRDKKIIRTLGYYGAQYSRQGQENASIASKAILRKFGQYRPLEVDYYRKLSEDASQEVAISGRLFEVLLPDSPDDPLKPSFVLETGRPDDPSAPLSVIPFEDIKTLRF